MGFDKKTQIVRRGGLKAAEEEDIIEAERQRILGDKIKGKKRGKDEVFEDFVFDLFTNNFKVSSELKR